MPPSAERAGQGEGDHHPQGNAEPSRPGPVGEHAAVRRTRGSLAAPQDRRPDSSSTVSCP